MCDVNFARFFLTN
ncbi:unnamed protein product [Lasius platythorax]|uniref:Uncharacterized protein n=1 Tax=Lasius platythorax TaxID=488582 RepID=A0AAV2NH00_9HYME